MICSNNLVKLVAPCHSIGDKNIENARNNSNLLGLNLIYDSDITNRYLDYAGTAKRRAREINEAYSNKDVNLILIAAGGNDAIEVLPFLNLKIIKKNKKPIVGFSDVTILLNYLSQKGNQIMIHGQNCTKYWKNQPYGVYETINHCVRKENYSWSIKDCKILNKSHNKICGRVCGGHLFLIADSIGTPFEIKTKNSILFIEANDLRGRRMYAILWQLKLAGKLKDVKGVVLGNFNNCLKHRLYLEEFFSKTQIPTIFSDKFGHHDKNFAFPIGANVILDFQNKKINFKFK